MTYEQTNGMENADLSDVIAWVHGPGETWSLWFWKTLCCREWLFSFGSSLFTTATHDNQQTAQGQSPANRCNHCMNTHSHPVSLVLFQNRTGIVAEPIPATGDLL